MNSPCSTPAARPPAGDDDGALFDRTIDVADDLVELAAVDHGSLHGAWIKGGDQLPGFDEGRDVREDLFGDSVMHEEA